MIIVVGRPGLAEEDRLDRLAGSIAQAAAQAKARVELVGSIGDDPDGDRVAVALGRADVGHAALLRDPAGVTPRAGGPGGPTPRLDEADVELGLSYLVDCRVLVVAEPVSADMMSVITDSAAYHDAQLVVVVGPGEPAPEGLSDNATVLEQPSDKVTEPAFARLVGEYAAGLGRGEPPPDAWRRAVGTSGWEPASDQGGGAPGDAGWEPGADLDRDLSGEPDRERGPGED
jgi:hypothetical protein